MTRLAALLVLSTVGQPRPWMTPACEPLDCLKQVSAVVPVELLRSSGKDLSGVWSHGGGLSGSYLYLFPDATYIYTEWGDVMPETIYDKGGWQVSNGVLLMSPASEVTWEPFGNRQYLVLRQKEGAPEPLLFGIHVSFHLFKEMLKEQPAKAGTWLWLSSYRRTRGWAPREPERVRADLMKKGWKPEWHTQ